MTELEFKLSNETKMPLPGDPSQGSKNRRYEATGRRCSQMKQPFPWSPERTWRHASKCLDPVSKHTRFRRAKTEILMLKQQQQNPPKALTIVPELPQRLPHP